jgi:EmrB/QacA subfamily drug resistance transporter
MPDAARHQPTAHPTRVIALLGLAAMAFSLAQTMVVPALSTLQTELHASGTAVTWTVTAYLLAAAVATPVVGRLGDMFGKQRLLIVALGAFTAGSVIAALADSITLIIVGRALQGVGGGIFPLCFAIVRDELPHARVATGIAVVSAIVGVGGGLGLVLGGVLLDHATWHWVFWAGAASGLVATVGAAIGIPESAVRTPGKVDVRGALVLGLGIALPLIAIANANTWGWGSASVLGLVAAGIVVLVGWVRLEQRTAEPIAHIPTLARPVVLLTNLASVLVGFGMFGAYVLIPQLLQASESTGYGFGYGATTSGLVMVPGAIAMLVLAPVSARLGRRFGGHVPLALGASLSALGLLLLGELHGSVLLVMLGFLINGSGIALAFAAMPNLIVGAVPAERTGEATGMNAVTRLIGSSLGTQITGAVLAGSVAGGVPTDHAFTTAFVVSAIGGLLAALLAAALPRLAGRASARIGDAATATSS